MNAVKDIVEDLVDLQQAERESRSPEVKRRLGRMAERRIRAQRGIPKAAAARMLGVSVNTVDKWIARKRIAVVRDNRSGRELVAISPFARLLSEVRALRAAGATDGILAAALLHLEQQDPQYRAEFDELYGASLQAMADDRLKPLRLPEGFGPED
jgi:Homeodomain-like domain